MKTIKAAISLLLLSSVSALAADAAPTSSASSLPMISAMTSGTKLAVYSVYGQGNYWARRRNSNSWNAAAEL